METNKEPPVLKYDITFLLELEIEATNEEEALRNAKLEVLRQLRDQKFVETQLKVKTVVPRDAIDHHESYQDDWADEFDDQW
ncbi:MAG: hypothetical protein ACXAD7_15860 [Candidatus Kariarchaeaceae archaeon]|jgi:hypothetical protein